jgi:hypothetical protein
MEQRFARDAGSLLVLFGRPADVRKLSIERLAVLNAAPEKLWPVWHLGQWVRRLWQETPQLWMMPAERLPGALSMLADSLP